MRFLVGPRLTAIVVLAAVPGGGFQRGGAGRRVFRFHRRRSFNIAGSYFLDLVREGLLVKDVIAGIIKSLLFGLIIGLVACFRGLTVKGGAAGVGEATTSSVVTSITSVIAADTLFNILLVRLYD